MSDRQMEDMARIAWGISPNLAIFLPDRLRNAEVIVREVTRLLRNNPEVSLLMYSYNFYFITMHVCAVTEFKCWFRALVFNLISGSQSVSRSYKISGNRTNREQWFARTSSRGYMGARNAEYSVILLFKVLRLVCWFTAICPPYIAQRQMLNIGQHALPRTHFGDPGIAFVRFNVRVWL